MDIKLLGIHNQGKANEEYVIMEVLQNCNIGDYLLADDTYDSNGKKSNNLRHVYFFPSKQVKKGELISLRTGKGENRELENDSGTKVHRFYWGLSGAVWNDDGDCAHLVYAPSSQRSKLKVKKAAAA